MNKESDSPLISIIVPVYNVEDYLAECINSLIQQTYHNLEIILVNDGSTDHSLKICKTFRALDKRIILISQKNQGLSSARNAGIKKMRGDFFTFVDSDDFLDKSFIEELYNAIIKFNCDIAIGGTTFEWSSRKVKKEPSITCFMPSVEIVKLFILKNDGILQSAWGKLYSSKIAYVLYFPVGKLFEDQFVMYHIVLSNSCCIVNGSTYHYRQARMGSILNVKNNSEKKVEDIWESLMNLKILLENQSVDLTQYLNYKIAIDSLDIVRYSIIGNCNNLIYQYALNKIEQTNLLDMKRLGLDLFTWMQLFMVKFMLPVYKMLLLQKYKE